MVQDRKKENRNFLLACIGFLTVLSIRFYGGQVNEINSTMLAFSYKYGFISRGFAGSIYQLLDMLIPVRMDTYGAVMVFTKAVTSVFFVILIIFFHNCLKRAGEGEISRIQYLAVFYLMMAAPFFVTKYNFGRLDIYMLMLSLLGAMIIMAGRGEWLLVPIASVAVMIHQGYVFMYLNILLVLLFVKVCDCRENKRRRYLTILISVFLTASVLFLWFELFSHVNGGQAYNQVVSLAKSLCRDGESIHWDVIDKEILGIDLTEREIPFHLQNAVQFPIFLVLVIPYLVIGWRFLKGMVRMAEGRIQKCKYFAIAAGALTILPDLLLKVDFGRWMFAIASYYLIVSMALLAMSDTLFCKESAKLWNWFDRHKGTGALLFVYPLVLQPFCDVSICHVTAYLAGLLNDAFLHWW